MVQIRIKQKKMTRFTACFMDHKIRHKITGKSYPKIYGKNSLTISAIKKLKEDTFKVYERR